MNLSRNIKVSSIHLFLSWFQVLLPVVVPYWRSLGLTMQEVLELQALFGLALALFEVPTGYLADLFGRKASVVIGGLISGIGFSYLPFAHTYNELLVFEILIALGSSCESGAQDAILYESIPEGRSRKEVLGSFGMYGLIAESLASLLSCVLVLHSFQWAVWVQACVGWGPFIVSLFLIEPPRDMSVNGGRPPPVVEVLRGVFVKDPMTRLVFINFVVWGLSSFSVVWLLQEYWMEVKMPLGYFGLVWAALMLVAAVASRLAHKIEHALGAHRMMCMIAALPILAYLLMAFAHPVIGVAAGAFFYVTRGLTYVVYRDAFNWRIPSSYRATANSLFSLVFRLAFVPIGSALGYVIDGRGLPSALVLLAIGFSLCAFFILKPLLRRLDKLHVEYIPEAA